MGALVRITSPLGAITQPVASTMRSDIGLMGFVETAGVLPTSGLRDTKSTCTMSALRASPGLGGKPPRPVIVKLLLATALPAVQVCATWVSTGTVGKLTKPLLGSISGVLSSTVPFTPNSELAVISEEKLG